MKQSRSLSSIRITPITAALMGVVFICVTVLTSSVTSKPVQAQSDPIVLDSRLAVRTFTTGLVTPTTMAFIGNDEFLVLEKNTGRVQHVLKGNGVLQQTVLDLAVNNASERGLLGIALDPSFSTNGFVYLYWTCRSPVSGNPFVPSATECADTPQAGADTGDVLAVPLLANRVDRFVWNVSSGTPTLLFDRNLIKLLAFQNDGAPTPPDQGDSTQPPRGNHDGGILAFGLDGKLYIMVGDLGRRGQLQNLPSGPTATGLGAPVADDQFGGPAPDRAHFAGAILRLNSDGTTPSDNPFFSVGTSIGGEVGENLKKIFAYGIRNSFGMAFDPFSQNLWDQENGEDAFDELNLIDRGMNSGWIQIMGPAQRLSEYKSIETTNVDAEGFPNLQQFRWGPERIANTPDEALARLFTLPGSVYSDPEFSWKHVLAPAGIGFLSSGALGFEFFGDLFVGFSTPALMGGPLFRFKLSPNRRMIAVTDPRLLDRVADNAASHDITESESLLFGTNFGIVTDIKTGPNGNLFVVSLDKGSVFEIHRNGN